MSLVDEINRQVADTRVRWAMLLGALLEGGSWSGPWGTATHGEYSVGPFQINLQAHGDITETQATDPAYAVRYMAPAYNAAIAQVPAGLWNTDPAQAAALTAYYAERPAAMYSSSRVSSAWQQVDSYLKSGAMPPGATTPAGGSNAAGGAADASWWNPLTWDPFGVKSAIAKDVRNITLTTTFLLGGVALVVLGMWRGVARDQVAARVDDVKDQAQTAAAVTGKGA